MRWISCAAIVILLTLVPSTHGMLASVANNRSAYALGTALMLVLAAMLPALWPRSVDAPPAARLNRFAAASVAIAGLALLVWVSVQLLPSVFAGPLDPNRGDMLVIIEHAIAQFLDGGNPYAIHHVPWDAPLSYGPVLWLPFVLPYLLRVDLRILTLAAQLLVPACLVLAAGTRAGRGDLPRAATLLCLTVALAVNPDILRFHAIGHTQIYWPLLLLFSLALAGGRWTAAALCLGLLVAARTTMVALVPVFFLHLAVTRSPHAAARRRIRPGCGAAVSSVRRGESRIGLLRAVWRLPQSDEGFRVVLDHMDAEHVRPDRPSARAWPRALRRDHAARGARDHISSELAIARARADGRSHGWRSPFWSSA